MAQAKPKFSPEPRHLILLILLVVALYVLLPQFSAFGSSWRLLGHPQSSYAAAAVVLTFLTYVAAAGTYCLLAFKPLKFGRTLCIQFAAMFVNRLLPAGIGALGMNYLYLRHQRHTASQAASAVTANNLIGFAGHGLLVALVIVTTQGAPISGYHRINTSLLVFSVVIVLAALVLLGWIFARQRVTALIADTWRQLFSYRRRPGTLAGALCTSSSLTLCNALCLLCCVDALHLHLAFVSVLLVFTFGVGAAAATPTPGGLGGFEAGLAAGFVAYGIDPGAALAAALLYRLISYWLPLIAGAAAFAVAQHQKWFEPA